MANGAHKRLAVLLERKKAQIRARVEHPFHIFKNLFGHKKANYRGPAKTWGRVYSLLAGHLRKMLVKPVRKRSRYHLRECRCSEASLPLRTGGA